MKKKTIYFMIYLLRSLSQMIFCVIYNNYEDSGLDKFMLYDNDNETPLSLSIYRFIYNNYTETPLSLIPLF